MDIRTSNQALVIENLDEFFVGLLRNIPIEAETNEDDPASERLYGVPFADEDDEACEEWREFVHPELETIFQDAMLTVRSDLQKMSASRSALGEYRLEVARPHFEAWLNALNQVRLVLAMRFQLTEADMDGQGPRSLASERDAAIFQVQFFGFIQEFLIRSLSEEDGD